MGTLFTVLMLLAPLSQSPGSAAGSVVKESGQVQQLPAAVTSSLFQRLLPYLDSCWLNSDTASLYLPPPLGLEEEVELAWERAIRSAHFRLLLSEPLLLSEEVGGQEISEIVFAADQEFLLSRHHGRVTKYRKCELPWSDVTCTPELEPYLPAENRLNCELIHRNPEPTSAPRQTLTLVFIRRTDIGSPLTIADDRQFLRPSDIDLLQSSGLTGRLTAEGHSANLEGRIQARALVVLCGPVDRHYELPVPSATTVVYTQHASGFITVPPVDEVDAESIELYPEEGRPTTIMYWARVGRGKSGGQALAWSDRSNPVSTCEQPGSTR